MINAQDARERTLDAIAADKEKEIAKVEKLILEAIDECQMECAVDDSLYPETIALLQSLGYKVDKRSNIYSITTPHYFISWE